MLSSMWLTVLLFVALAVVSAAPIILLTLWFADLKKGDLW